MKFFAIKNKCRRNKYKAIQKRNDNNMLKKPIR